MRALISRLVLPVCLLVFALMPVPATQAQDPCAGLVPPRLSIGANARVVAPYGLSLKNQAATGAAGSVELALLPYGSAVTVLDGPQCRFNYVWWSVETPGGTIGWAAEGSSSDYFMEPYTVSLPAYRMVDEGARIVHYSVMPDGLGQPVNTFTVAPLDATPANSWQQVEIDTFSQVFAAVQQTCPDRLKGTPWETPDSQAAPLNVPLPALDYEFYPAPDGSRLLLVRHLTLDVPRCETVIPRRIGMNRVSLLNADGTETELFPFPQNGSVPASEDRYALSEPDAPNVYLDEIVWSPQGKYIAFVAAYLDQCAGQGCYRFHMYISNLETGQLYVVGEGRHVGWSNGGERINFFRLIREADDRQVAHLYTMRPDGTDRQEVWLPGGAAYISTQQTGYDLPWNDGGTRVMVGNAGGIDEVMLFNLNDRAFTPPVLVPDLAPLPNRLAINLVKGEKTILWTTIRGQFILQTVNTGDWTVLNSQVSSLGVPTAQVRTFLTGDRALVEMADGSAYILEIDRDLLTPVTYNP